MRISTTCTSRELLRITFGAMTALYLFACSSDGNTPADPPVTPNGSDASAEPKPGADGGPSTSDDSGSITPENDASTPAEAGGPTPDGGPPGSSVVMVGAGDIASCSSSNDEATATLVDGIPGTVFLAGDNAYETGAANEYTNCYAPSWGRHKARTKPVPGNHEYYSWDATPYFNYFGAAAGDPKKGYYSYDVGDWHVIAINSNCSSVGGCNAGSPQETWLRADLKAHPNRCTMAYWHHPRFSSGAHGNDTSVRPLWQALYDNDADLVINGHDHNYERFAPQTPAGTADPARGIVEIVIGTGGRDLRAVAPGDKIANSVALNSDTFGVLKLTLTATGYAYEFVKTPGGTFSDSGSGNCH